MKIQQGISIVLLSLLAGCGANDTTEEQSATDNIQATGPSFDLIETPIGGIDFPTTCDTTAGPLVERGVALIHHMMYEEAELVFSMADDADPDCAMAYWGIAMAQIQPVGRGPLYPEQYERGSAMMQRALSLDVNSERERDYLEATMAYLEDSVTVDPKVRAENMSNAMGAISQKYPDDMDAKAFQSLFTIVEATNASDDVSSNAKREEAAALSFDILETIPDHPGAHHYIIHALDTPSLARLAEEIADHYGEITPRVPHASHMMTHTYTRLGNWDKSIEWNDVSAEAALELCLAYGEVNLHYPHAMDYLAYAHLQKGDDETAASIMDEILLVDMPPSTEGINNLADAYASIPARYALERKDWEFGASIIPQTPSHFPWGDRFARSQARVHFARAISLINLGRQEEATGDIEAIATHINNVDARLADADRRRNIIKVMELSSRAWQHFANGNLDNALNVMEEAVALEQLTPTGPGTVGDVIPAAELFGDMLMELSRYEEAIAAYDIALDRAPNRYNSLYSAGQAAMEIGNEILAERYFNQLLENAQGVEVERNTTAEVRDIMASL